MLLTAVLVGYKYTFKSLSNLDEVRGKPVPRVLLEFDLVQRI